MTIDFLMGSYKNSICRPPSSPTPGNKSSTMGVSDDHYEIPCGQGTIDGISPARIDTGRISFLEVPKTCDLRRPSTADIVIEKLKVEKLEGGGLTISGFVLTGNCHISLIIFGIFFLVAGIVLTYVGFAVCNHHDDIAPSAGSSSKQYHDSDHHKQMQIIGPIFMLLGIVMTLLGISLCGISRKVSRDAKAKRIASSTAQLSQMENSFFQNQVTAHNSPVRTTAPGPNEAFPILSLRRGSWWMEPTPIELSQYKSDSTVPSPDVASFDIASRTSSPTLNIKTQIWTRPESVANQGRRMSTKRLSSPHTNIFYGEEQPMDIATFPTPDYDLDSSYPGRVPFTDSNRRESVKSDQKSQIFEVIEAANCEPHDHGPEFDDEKEETNPGIPKITVSNARDVQSSSNVHREVKEDKFFSNTLMTNSSVPLAKNGITLPRLSRHSLSRPEILQASRSTSKSFEDR